MNENPFFPLKEPQGGSFYCEPLSAEHKRVLKTFLPSHPKGKNLASYLKKRALDDMANGIARTFLVFEESHIKPDYDEDCDFMFIHLENEKSQTKKKT